MLESKTPPTMRRRFGLALGQSLLGGFCQGSKAVWISNRDVRKHLAVHVDVSDLQAVHQLAVGKTIDPRSSVDPGNPQGAEVTLGSATIAESVTIGNHDLGISCLEQQVLGAAVTLSQL